MIRGPQEHADANHDRTTAARPVSVCPVCAEVEASRRSRDPGRQLCSHRRAYQACTERPTAETTATEKDPT